MPTRAFALVLVLGADALDVLDLLQRAARRGDHRLAGRRDRRDAFARPHENTDAELVFQLADLLADPGLRREQRGSRVRHVEPVIDDGAQIAQLLEVQGEGPREVRISVGRNYRAAPARALANPRGRVR